MDVKDETALSCLRKLEITAERLNTILTRLLIINQINHSTPGKDHIDFDSMVNDVILLEKKKGMPPRFKINSEIQERITFFSDKELIRIILENLIDNAIKFHNDSERIDPFVNIKVTKKDSQIDIRVIDNGIGIDEDDSEKVFQMFSRASERSETGGIGLYLTRTAAEKLGGTVSISTTQEGFTEFRVRF
jgi:signal transduction histidine kinase